MSETYSHKGGQRFTVELEAMPDDVPPIPRLKRFLKNALRAYRLRALRVSQTQPTGDPTTEIPPAKEEKGRRHDDG